MLTMREKLQAFSGFKDPFASLPLGIWLWQNDGLFAIQTRERSMSKKEKGGLSFSSSRVSSFMLEEAKKRGATSASLSNLLHPKFTLRFLPVASSLAIGRDQALPTFVVTTNFRTLSFSSLNLYPWRFLHCFEKRTIFSEEGLPFFIPAQLLFC